MGLSDTGGRRESARLQLRRHQCQAADDVFDVSGGRLCGAGGRCSSIGIAIPVADRWVAGGFHRARPASTALWRRCFGGLNPIGAIPAAAFFGGLLVGAQKMQRELGVPASLITAVNGLIVVFVVSSEIFILQRSKRRVSVGENESPAGSPTKREGLGSRRRGGGGRLMGLDDILTASVFASAIRLGDAVHIRRIGGDFRPAQRSAQPGR